MLAHQQARKGETRAGRTPTMAGGRARVTIRHARNQPVMGNYCVRGGVEPFAYAGVLSADFIIGGAA